MDIKKDITSVNTTEEAKNMTENTASFGIENKAKNEKISSFFNRTQKIVTAIYMVTECIETGEPIKNSLRTSSLDLLKIVFLTDNKSAIRTHFDIEEADMLIKNILSVLEISQVVGLVGTMNSGILMKELTKLANDLSIIRNENVRSSFSINGLKRADLERADFLKNISFKSYEDTDLNVEKVNDSESILKMFLSNSKGQGHLNKVGESNYKGHTSEVAIKNTDKEFKKDKVTGQSKKIDLAIKNERRNSILLALRDKGSVTVKDMSLIVKNCSEKTLQRELTNLVKDNVLKKTGDKRWSKYSLV